MFSHRERLIAAMQDHDFIYSGSELELFSSATNWRGYWTQRITPFVSGSVLEVGSGIGSLTRLMSPLARHWVALEPDAHLASQIDLDENSSTVSVIVGTLRDIPKADKFDTILYADVLEHIEDDATEIRHAIQHLNSGGNLIVLAPAHQSLFSPFDEAIGHYRRYSSRQLLALAPVDGTVTRLEYLDACGLLASVSNRLLLRSDMPTRAQISFWDRYLVPISRRLDRLLRGRLGKSVLLVWTKA